MLVETYEKGNIEKSAGFNFDTLEFGVKSPALIFDILCNRMYQKPLQTMIQEYMSNARDAHREIGNDAVPIEVTLPTSLDPYIRIRDFGPGLTEERIQEVFVFLGESTKRTSNLQTGGFGIGAKVGWAYSDSFTIHSTVDGITWSYLAYLGDDHVGKLSALSSVETEEANGVEIQIRINDDDIRETEQAVHLVSYFWEVLPVVHNRCYTEAVGYKGSHTGLHVTHVPGMRGSEYIAIVDGIPYIIDMNNVNAKKFHMPYNSDKNVCLFFNVGELDLAVNREGLRYSERTIQAVDSKFSVVQGREGDRKWNIEAAFTIHEKAAAMKDYFGEVYIMHNIQSWVIQDAIEVVCAWNDNGNPTVRFKERRKILSKNGTIPRTAWYLNLYEITSNDDLVSGISCNKIPQNISGSFSHKVSEKYYVWKGNGPPSKDKGRTLFDAQGHRRGIKVITVSDDYTYNQLVSAGYPSLNDIKDTPLEKKERTARVLSVNTEIKGLFDRNETLNMYSVNPAKHCYCRFAERDSMKAKINRICGGRRDFSRRTGYEVYYITQEQLAAMKVKLPHVNEIIGRAAVLARVRAMVSAAQNPESVNDALTDIRNNSCSGINFLYSFFRNSDRRESLIDQLELILTKFRYLTSLYTKLPSHSNHDFPGRKYTTKKVYKDRAMYGKMLLDVAIEIVEKYPMARWISMPSSQQAAKLLHAEFEKYVAGVQQNAGL